MGSVGEEEMQQWEKTQAVVVATAAATNGGWERMLVSVRLRPLSEKEIARNELSDWECINDKTIIFRNSHHERSMVPTAYTFDRVFRGDCSTKQVYEEAAKEVALSVVSGINSSIFAYGQTSSGKTYTMNGITEYTIADIYNYIQRHEERAFVLKFSAMEIYNEAVRDLLTADSAPLRLLDDPERGTIVEKLTEETLRDSIHMRQLLSICEAQRQVGETSLNEASSRSHQILRLTIESSAREFLGKDNSSTLSASVNFVDLAGSERASQALSAGTRLKEGCHINRSLLTLGSVIRKLSKGRNGHIPYRDSKLTRILQPSLGGNARTAIICTMSPARSHIEQSRNTLLFATCAKEVVTSAQVNVVMSDKALVKHLQKELARLENELKAPGQSWSTTHNDVLMRKKDAQIQKMEKEMKVLTEQRDVAQSRVEILIRFVGRDQAFRLWAEYNHAPAIDTPYACIDELSVSEPSVPAEHTDFSFPSFNTQNSFKEYCTPECDEQHIELSFIPEDQVLFGANTSRLSFRSLNFAGSVPGQEMENMDGDDDSEYQCKEVRCIEMEESSTSGNEDSSDMLDSTRNGRKITLIESSDMCPTEQGLESIGKGSRELRHVDMDLIENHVEPSEDPLFPAIKGLSSTGNLIKAKSQSSALSVTDVPSPWTQGGNEHTPPSGPEKNFSPRSGSFRGRPQAFTYGEGIDTLSRNDSLNSDCSASIGTLDTHTVNNAPGENKTTIHSFVGGIKEMAKFQYEKQLMDAQDEEPQSTDDFGTGKTSKDAAVDPMQICLESPSRWALEFAKLQSQIIELWHACNTSLVHRTYFFLLFSGDPADSIYVEVELRRLSFLKNAFSHGTLSNPVMENGRIVTPNSCMRALRREREMLSRQMRKRFSKEERESIYINWGIGLDTKRRRLQLTSRLWIDIADMDHVRSSAAIVAKLLGFVEPGQAMKEMFGLSFTPGRPKTSRRSLVWKNSLSSLL